MTLKSIAAPIAGPTICLMLSGCFPGEDADIHWASRKQVVQAAARCGIQHFEPTQAGAAWAAYVPGENPDKGPRGDCIYADLKSRGLTATR
jgi:hypothetical protein